MATYIKSTSRLFFADLIQLDDFIFFDLPTYPEIPAQSDDLRYEVNADDRIDTIAYQFYGDSVLWWVIAVANSFELLPTALSVGQIIRIPSPRYVRDQLFKSE